MSEQSASRRLGTGTWLSIGSPVIAELAAACGFDWLLFDMEHGFLTESAVLANLQAAKREGIRLIVRVGSLDSALIARILDWGASGIMLPHVSTVREAEVCLSAMTYPPGGTRGYSGSSRVFQYGLDRGGSQSPQPMFIPQIEDYEGVLRAGEIAAVPGVDVLFVGPADLKLDLASRPQRPDLTYEQALQRVSEAARYHRKQAGILVRNPDDLPLLKQAGFSCLAIGSDLAFIRDGFLEAVKRTK